MNRRGFLKAFGASFVAVDAIARGVMMPVKELILPPAGIQTAIDNAVRASESIILTGHTISPIPPEVSVGDILFIERPNGYNEIVEVVLRMGNGLARVRCMEESFVPQSEAPADTIITKIGCTIDESSLGLRKT